MKRRGRWPLYVGAVLLPVLGGCSGECEDDGWFQSDPSTCSFPPAAEGSTGAASTGELAESSEGTTGGESSGSDTIGLLDDSTDDTTGDDSDDSDDTTDTTDTTASGSSDDSSDDSESGTTSVPTTLYCADEDTDGFGDPTDCLDVPDGEDPPRGWVADDQDCSDSEQAAFPGAAPSDDATACLLDVDDDDFGDAYPPAGIAAGSDCDDDDPMVPAVSACICTPLVASCDAENVVQCNASGTAEDPLQACISGCDEGTATCWPELTIDADDAATCAEVTPVLAPSVQLSSAAAGGDGNYTYVWTPAASLDDAASPAPTASPTATTSYSVTVTDGQGFEASDTIAVHALGTPWLLDDPGCETFIFPNPDDGIAGDPSFAFSAGGTTVCNEDNALPNALVCAPVLQDASFTTGLQVATTSDNDAVGVVWGWQDERNFYVLSWKQAEQMASELGDWPEGVTIKRVSVPADEDVTAADILGAYDTPNSVLLAGPDDFYATGWEDNVAYTLQLDFASPTTTISIVEVATLTTLVSDSIVDATYPAGRVGLFDASQADACKGPLTSSCL